MFYNYFSLYVNRNIGTSWGHSGSSSVNSPSLTSDWGSWCVLWLSHQTTPSSKLPWNTAVCRHSGMLRAAPNSFYIYCCKLNALFLHCLFYVLLKYVMVIYICFFQFRNMWNLPMRRVNCWVSVFLFQEHFQEVTQHQEFLQLPTEEAARLLASDDLNVPSEELIFQVYEMCHASLSTFSIYSCHTNVFLLDSIGFFKRCSVPKQVKLCC